MLVLIAKFLIALATGGLFIFTAVLGERNNFRVQRGWYIIVLALGLLWLASLMNLAQDHIPMLSTEFFQVFIKKAVGRGGGTFALLLGMILWAPKITAFRDSYTLKIKTSEERFRMLAEKATDMLAEHDTEGRFLYATPGSKQIVGYTPEELESRSIYDFVDPEQLEMVKANHYQILMQKEAVTSTYKFKHKEGHFIWLESVTRLYAPQGGEDEGRILAMSRDVSERIRHEMELKDLNEDLELQRERFRMLYTLAVSEHLETAGKFDLTLATAAKSLGMGLGIISRIEGNEYKVLHYYPETAPLEKGQIFDLGLTYCSITVEKGGVVAIDEMSNSQHNGHPCWEAMHLESYIGVPIYVLGKVYGTLNFSQPEARKTKFSEGDKDFIRLVGQWVGSVIANEKTSKRLRESEELNRSISQTAADAIVSIDEKGNVLSWNNAAQSIFGYTESAIKKQGLSIIIPADMRAGHGNALKKLLAGGEATLLGKTIEIIGARKNGETFPVELSLSRWVSDKQMYYTGILRDITERKKVESDLANAHLRLKNIFDSATQVAIIATDLEGNISIFNPGAELMLGYSADEVYGKSSSIFHLESEVESWSKELSSQLNRKIEGFETFVALAKMGGQAEHEWTYVRKDGSHLTVNSKVTALLDTSNTITGFLGIILDITSRKQAEEALLLAKSLAEEANQTKSDFLANMSHELRTPLNSVIGFSSILLNTLAKKIDKKDITYLERIHENGKHLLMLINDVLDLSKIEAGRMELEIVEINLGVQIQEIVDQLESLVQKKPVKLLTIIPDDLEANLIDPGKMKQVLMNLISNSIKFTSEGSITIELIKNDETNKVSGIKVIDTGIGIPPDRLEKIFDEFSQVDSSTQRKYGGTGLGLSISRRMCHLMNCSLDVKSEVGKGSTFIITLSDQELTETQNIPPIRKSKKTRDKKRDAAILQDDLSGNSILIVDDDVDSRTLLHHYLANTGCEIEAVSSAKEAFEAIRKKRPDLITLDIQMPKISGEKFLKALKNDQELKDIPVVVVSIVARENRGQLAGVVDFIQKPVNRQQLLWAIKRNLMSKEKRILIVEDDPDMRLTLSNYIGEEGIDIRSAEDGATALEIIQTSVPNLILLDLMMPGMDGMEFLRILKDSSRFHSIPIIVVTGKDLSPSEKIYFRTEEINIVSKGDKLEQELKHQVNNIFLI